MIILPAIDIKDGQCVRLSQGDYATAQRVADDPVQTARAFEAAGAQWLHMVDLDGAKDAKLTNRDIFLAVAKCTALKIEVGGGIRSLDAAEDYLSNGISRIILGSAAITEPELVKKAVKAFGSARVAVGIDAKDGMAASEGWLDKSAVDYIALARAMCAIGVKYIIYTDIARDGMLSGPNLAQLEALQNACEADIIASGGIRNIDDIRALKKLGLYGAICGKSLYSGTLDLKQAIKEAGDQVC